jgi:hypothetical protein
MSSISADCDFNRGMTQQQPPQVVAFADADHKSAHLQVDMFTSRLTAPGANSRPTSFQVLSFRTVLSAHLPNGRFSTDELGLLQVAHQATPVSTHHLSHSSEEEKQGITLPAAAKTHTRALDRAYARARWSARTARTMQRRLVCDRSTGAAAAHLQGCQRQGEWARAGQGQAASKECRFETPGVCKPTHFFQMARRRTHILANSVVRVDVLEHTHTHTHHTQGLRTTLSPPALRGPS